MHYNIVQVIQKRTILLFRKSHEVSLVSAEILMSLAFHDFVDAIFNLERTVDWDGCPICDVRRI